MKRFSLLFSFVVLAACGTNSSKLSSDDISSTVVCKDWHGVYRLEISPDLNAKLTINDNQAADLSCQEDVLTDEAPKPFLYECKGSNDYRVRVYMDSVGGFRRAAFEQGQQRVAEGVCPWKF